ncbi:MAG: hypothetical protein ACYDCK_03475 [Thermoplasmatota archaeon]
MSLERFRADALVVALLALSAFVGTRESLALPALGLVLLPGVALAAIRHRRAADVAFAGIVGAVALGDAPSALEPALFVLAALLLWEEHALARLAGTARRDALARLAIASARNTALRLAIASGLVAFGVVLLRESATLPASLAGVLGALFAVALVATVLLASRIPADESA